MTSTMIKHIAIGFRLTALVVLGAGAGQIAAAARPRICAGLGVILSPGIILGIVPDPEGDRRGAGSLKGEVRRATSSCSPMKHSASTRFRTAPTTCASSGRSPTATTFIATRVKAATTSDKAQLGALEMPTGETKSDEYFGKQEIYHHELVAGVPVARASAAELALPLQVTYQGCATAGLCYPPITKEIMVSLPSGNGGGGCRRQHEQLRSAQAASAAPAARARLAARQASADCERPPDRRSAAGISAAGAADANATGATSPSRTVSPPSSSRATPS